MLNYSLKEFTKNCKKKISQVLYIKIKAKNSAPNSIKRPEEPKKVNISHKTE